MRYRMNLYLTIFMWYWNISYSFGKINTNRRRKDMEVQKRYLKRLITYNFHKTRMCHF